MNNKHTPGPWSITRYSNYEGWSVHAKERGCIAERWYDKSCPYPDEQLSANAYLVAAAPDMKDCCVWTMAKLQDLMETVPPQSPMWNCLQALVVMNGKVINQAEGFKS